MSSPGQWRSATLLLCVAACAAQAQENTPPPRSGEKSNNLPRLKPTDLQVEHPDCSSLQFSPDGRYMITSSFSRTGGGFSKAQSATIKVWDAVGGKMIGEPLVVGKQVAGAPQSGPWISADSKYLVLHKQGAGSQAPVKYRKNQAIIRELSTLKIVGEPLQFEGGFYGSMSVNASGQIATVDPDFAKGQRGKPQESLTTRIQLWDMNSRKPLGDPHTLKLAVMGMTFSSGNKQALLFIGRVPTAQSRSIQVYDLDKASMIGDPWPTGTVHELVLDSEGKFAITRATDQSGFPDSPRLEGVKLGQSWEVLRRWEVVSGKNVGKPIHVRNRSSTPKEESDHDHAAMYSDARTVAVRQDQRTVQVVNMETGKPLGPPLKHTEPVYWMLFSADGKQLWTASGSFARSDGCWLWDVASGQRMAQLPQEGKIVAMALHPNQKLISAVDDRGLVRTWHLISSK